MGITRLNKFTETLYIECPEIFSMVNIDNDFKNKRIGVDILNIIHFIKKRYPSDFKVGLKILFDFFKNNNTTPIFVFDGEFKHGLKKCKSVKRKKEHRNKDLHFEILKLMKNYIDNKYKNLSTLNSEIKKLINKFEKKEKEMYPDEEPFIKNKFKINNNTNVYINSYLVNNIQLFNTTYEWMRNECTYASYDEIKECKKYINQYNMSNKTLFYIFNAHCEADFILGQLSRMGIVDSCLSNDTDLMVLGVNKIIKFNNEDFMNFRILHTNILIDFIKTKYHVESDNINQFFIDICILSGSDYSDDVYVKGDNTNTTQHYLIIDLKNCSIDEFMTKTDLHEKYTNIQKIFDKFKIIKDIYLKTFRDEVEDFLFENNLDK